MLIPNRRDAAARAMALAYRSIPSAILAERWCIGGRFTMREEAFLGGMSEPEISAAIRHLVGGGYLHQVGTGLFEFTELGWDEYGEQGD